MFQASTTAQTDPVSQTGQIAHQDVLTALRSQIRQIERRPDSLPDQDAGPVWKTDIPDLDTLLGVSGLEIGAVHEVKPALQRNGSNWTAAWASALAFSLTLARRRSLLDGASGPILCCRPTIATGEFGGLYGPGLRALGIDPARLIIVETGNVSDALWAIEEGLKSASTAMVIGVLDEVDLTPARRLALAAASHRSPCILLTHPRAEATAAVATRWRVGSAPSAPHPFDERAPGHRSFSIALERCRAQPIAAEAAAFCVEWCDETFCFRLASRLVDRTPATRRSARGAG